ncbi:MAG: FkbM family methyltransferase [bacterium]|nr:FkbM family methyltransferase [bacterium]
MIYLDPADFAVSEEISAGGYEADEVELVTRLIRPTDTVIDIGANIGYFTVLFCDVAREGTVHSFEPSPKTCSFLRKNIESNGFKNAHVYEMAVGDRDGHAQIFINEYNKGDNRLYPSFGAKGVDIRVAMLDSVIPPDTKVDFIKMDTQGYEVYALRGMRRVVRDSPDLRMIVECWPKGLKKAGSSIEEFFSELENAGFSWRIIDGGELRTVSKEAFIAKFPTEKDDYANLLCWRGKKLPHSVVIST